RGRRRSADRGATGGSRIGSTCMISVPSGARILLATRPVDFRKGAHGLAALAQEVLAENPFSGAVIVWRCKRGDRVKILVWDTSGLVLIWKQLQQGSFRWPPIMNGAMKLSPVEFAALFDGLDWPRVQTIKTAEPRRLLAWMALQDQRYCQQTPHHRAVLRPGR